MKYLCTFCGIFVYDEDAGDANSGLKKSTKIKDIPDEWRCPVCGETKSFIKEISDEDFAEKIQAYRQMYPSQEAEPLVISVASDRSAPDAKKDLVYYREQARKILSGVCAVNKVCDGNPDRLCMGQRYGRAIGFGAAGQGRTFDANFRALERYRLRMRVIGPHREPDLSSTFLGHPIPMPILVTSMSGVAISMNDHMPEQEFQRGMIEGAKLFGTIGLSGNTVDQPEHPGVEIIKENNGWGIPVFKPQQQDTLLSLFKRADAAGCIAIGIDLDGFGSLNWALRGKPVYRKSESELKELIKSTKKPVILKGIMTLEDAQIAMSVGAKAIDISNHGGRVMDYGQGVADVLPQIARELKGKITIMADGAVRTGYDAAKLLALGADVALTGREVGRMSLAGGAEAVKMHLDYLKADLRQAMIMTGCAKIKDIDKSILFERKSLYSS